MIVNMENGKALANMGADLIHNCRVIAADPNDLHQQWKAVAVA
jgi:hypothetical protein